MTDKICAHGNSFLLTEEEQRKLSEVTTVVLDALNHAVYFKIHLRTTRRVIQSASRSRSHRRDNSGIVYSNQDSEICFGKFEKMVIVDSHNEQVQGFAIIQCLPRISERLCNDPVTSMKLDEHIISLCKSRYAHISYTNDTPG